MDKHRGIKDKIIVVTGGCGDIGSAITQRLAAYGAKVIVFDLWDSEAGHKHVNEQGGSHYARVDQGDAAEVHQAIASVSRDFGRLDVVIANAAHMSVGYLLDRTAEDWMQSLRVNVIGSAMLAQASVKQMLTQSEDEGGVRGKVLFTTSWVGTYPYPGSIDYCASKAAIDHLARLIAQEYADQGIRVNAVAPGILDSGGSRKAVEQNRALLDRMLSAIPVGELGTAEQVADAFLFLCSKESNYMTGHTLFVDGGCSLTKR